MMSDDTKKEVRRGFFGRRKGHRLRSRQAALLDSLLPRLALDLNAPPPSDLVRLFPAPVENVRFEIGFGGGEYLIAQAQAHPRTGFIGCEPFVNGMAKARRHRIPRARQHPTASRRRRHGDRLAAGRLARRY
jgi:tRNA (guanine-N7-)-methyltransferase